MSNEPVPGSKTAPSAQISKNDTGASSGAPSAQGSKDNAPSSNSTPRGQVSKKDGQNSRNGLVAQVVGNASVVAAALVYMGWAYEAALLGYFHVSAIGFNLSALQYVLKSTPFFFHPAVILGAVVVVIILVVIGPKLGRFAQTHTDTGIGRVLRSDLATGLGLLILVGLVWFGLKHNQLALWFSSHPGFFYVTVALIGIGSLIVTWPGRVHHSLFAHALAIVIAAVCVLWIAGLYASSLGTRAAVTFANSLSAQTAVALYSVNALNLSGPGVICQRLPTRSLYHYRYAGLRLLYVDSGTYYLLPVNWISQHSPTYVFQDNDQIRIELGGSDFGLDVGRMGCGNQ
jgi:hypothetical protein